jgi:hypothetical protein
VLWNPGALCGKAVEPAATAVQLAAEVGTIDGLDPSQQSAVAHAIERALTVIWGPPGTGKTKTLGAILHAITRHAFAMRQPVRVLVTGPTYKAVQEVMERTAQFLSGDTSAPCKMFMGYTSGRTQAPIPAGLNGHVAYRAMQFDSSDAEFKNCLNEIQVGQSVTIVGCQVRQARRFPQQLSSQCLHPIFDVVVIDESSQVTVSQSLAALTGLKDGSRLIIAGDYKQMPPISSVDPPAEAAYLVNIILPKGRLTCPFRSVFWIAITVPTTISLHMHVQLATLPSYSLSTQIPFFTCCERSQNEARTQPIYHGWRRSMNCSDQTRRWPRSSIETTHLHRAIGLKHRL